MVLAVEALKGSAVVLLWKRRLRSVEWDGSEGCGRELDVGGCKVEVNEGDRVDDAAAGVDS